MDFNQRLQNQTKMDENPFAALGISQTSGQSNAAVSSFLLLVFVFKHLDTTMKDRDIYLFKE